MIKKVLLLLCAFFAVLTLHAQKDNVFKGYLYNDAVIRPSMVKVGFRNKETKEEAKAETKTDNLEGAENNKKENN